MAVHNPVTIMGVDSAGNPVPVTIVDGAACVTQTMTGSFASGILTDTTPEVVSMLGAPKPATVWVNPTSDTITVAYSTDGGTTYNNWPLGTVSAYAKDTLLSGVTHLRFTAGTGNAASTYGVL